MEIKMDNIQGRLLLEESLDLTKEYHNNVYDNGYGRGVHGYNWWKNSGNSTDLEYYYDAHYQKYDFNMIWKIMN